MTKKLRLGVMLSGGGTTLLNILDRIDGGTLDAEVVVVVSSLSKAKGKERAEKRGIPTHVVRRKDYDSTETFSEAINRVLDEADVDLVCLAGFMVMWRLPKRYLGHVMNIHPALIPSFCGHGMYGHFVHEAVVAKGAKVSGCTVHFVNNEYDAGPIIVQKAVPVRFEDTPDDVAKRVFEKECEAYPEAIQLFAEGRLKIEDNRVKILPERK
ncbi:MAG: phosphoribosylglycinamide formyltransferase [Planctomycetes bacterium]|nr:phosphoribosylglycinamide formyltransferase [Planctomycetota bacterium]